MVTEEIFQSFLNCKTKSYLKFSRAIDTQPEFRDWQRRQIEDYRQKCYDQLRSKFGEDECLTDVSFPQALENSKCHLVFDCLVKSQEIRSNIHALERVTSSDKKRHSSYIPIRFVPYKKITKQDRLLLAYDALTISLATGKIPFFGKIIYSCEHKTTKVQLPELVKTTQSIVAEIIKQHTSRTVPQLILNKHCPQCEFESECRQIAHEKDDLSLLPNMTEKERQKQHNKGIFTVTQLSYTFRPRKRAKRLASKPKKYNHALKALAIRENKIHVARRSELNLIGTPVYLDVEGSSDQDFYYLIGLRTKSDSSYIQHSFWANELTDEKVIWVSFLQTLSKIENPQLIYFGNYEKVFLKRMNERYSDTVETPDFIEQLIATSVNLLSFTAIQ